jgi:hypothetical protein
MASWIEATDLFVSPVQPVLDPLTLEQAER